MSLRSTIRSKTKNCLLVRPFNKRNLQSRTSCCRQCMITSLILLKWTHHGRWQTPLWLIFSIWSISKHNKVQEWRFLNQLRTFIKSLFSYGCYWKMRRKNFCSKTICKLWDLNSMKLGRKSILFQRNISLRGLIGIGMRSRANLVMRMVRWVSMTKRFLTRCWRGYVREWKPNGIRKLNSQLKEIGKAKVVLGKHPNFTMKISKEKETIWITDSWQNK